MPRRTRSTPAERVISLFGVRPLAAVLDIDPGAVIKWRERTGRVPSRHMGAILALARKRGVALTADELIA